MNIENLGASFDDAFECNSDQLVWVINAFGEPHFADVLYHSDQVTVTRFFTQTGVGRIRTFNAMYIAQLEGTHRFIVVCGTIKTSKINKVQEYETVGKRMLYNATKELWNIRY